MSPELSVASTTDDAVDVRIAAQATDIELRDGAMPAPIEEPSEPQAPTEENREQREVRHRPRTSVQKRLDKITAQKYQLAEEKEQALREVSELREKLAAYEGRPELQPVAEREARREAHPEPQPQREVKQHPEAQELPDAAHLTANLNRHAERMADAFRRNPELCELTNVDVPIRPDISVAILEEESSAELAIYLAKHPQEVEQLNDMPAWKAYQAVSRLAGRLERGSSGPRPVPRPKPQPIRPVGGSSTLSNVPLDEMSFADSRRHREAQEKAYRRR